MQKHVSYVQIAPVVIPLSLSEPCIMYGISVHLCISSSRGFAFVRFHDERDAEDCMREMDGEKILSIHSGNIRLISCSGL